VHWWDLSALSFHYWTQPLPHVGGWLVHQLPDWFDQLSVLVMFGIELIVPFFIFFSRKFRLVAFGCFVGFQIVIMVTGNYGFFNVLTIVLCVVLLDDGALERVFGQKRVLDGEKRDSRFKMVCVGGVCVVLVLLMTHLELQRFYRPGLSVVGMDKVSRVLYPFHLVGRYGLFASMTTNRREIEIQGSLDGVDWRPYLFAYKPNQVTDRPVWVMPHQPRLDWQMWFLALGPYDRSAWFSRLCLKLLEGSGDVEGLFLVNPFEGARPRYLKAVVREFGFSSFSELRMSGQWWQAGLVLDYTPVFSLGQGSDG